MGTHDFESCTIDHSDNSPSMRSTGFPDVFLLHIDFRGILRKIIFPPDSKGVLEKGKNAGENSISMDFSNLRQTRLSCGVTKRLLHQVILISSAPSYDLLSTSPYSIVQHRLARPSDKCKISMQDKRIITGCIPRENPAVTPFLADESASGLQTFECDLLSNAPSAPLCTAYSSL